MQQIVPISISLVGDGVTKVFRFKLSSLFSFRIDDQSILADTSAVPTAVSAASDFPGVHVTASIGTNSTIVLGFDNAPANGQQGSVSIGLLFASL